MSEINCPRCHDTNGTEGYLRWEDTTPEERVDDEGNPIVPDSDNEIECPVCHAMPVDDEDPAVQAYIASLQPPPDPAIRGLEWANVPIPEDVPPAKFRFNWDGTPDDADVIAVQEGTDQEFRIGLLSWSDNSWRFTRLDRNGDRIVGEETIECDPAEETRLREMEVESRTNAANEAVLEGHLAAIATQARLLRDDSRDIAILGATIIARKWWRLFWSDAK